MSFSVVYSAIPPGSTLYQRVRHDKAFSILVVSLFSSATGIFDFFELEPELINEALDDVLEKHRETFGTELEADDIIAEFRSELRRTRKTYPGIEDRMVVLEKTDSEIENRLLQELSEKQFTNADKLVEKLMSGDQTLAPTILPADKLLRLISRELVKEGAEILRQIHPEKLFVSDDGWESYCLKDLERWRNLYLLADQKGEELLVGLD